MIPLTRRWRVLDERAPGERGQRADSRVAAQRSAAGALKGIAHARRAVRPRPIAEEVMAANTSASGAWKAEQLAKWGVAWPPPKGWRRDLEEKHRLGLRVVPLAHKKSRRGERRGPDGRSDRTAGPGSPRPAKGARPRPGGLGQRHR